MANQKVVRIAMTVPADQPDEQAVLTFVERIIATGLRSLVYAVTDAGTAELLGIYDGYGNAVKAVDDTVDPGNIITGPNEGEPVIPRDDSDSDAALLALSRSLDDADERSTP